MSPRPSQMIPSPLGPSARAVRVLGAGRAAAAALRRLPDVAPPAALPVRGVRVAPRSRGTSRRAGGACSRGRSRTAPSTPPSSRPTPSWWSSSTKAPASWATWRASSCPTSALDLPGRGGARTGVGEGRAGFLQSRLTPPIKQGCGRIRGGKDSVQDGPGAHSGKRLAMDGRRARALLGVDIDAGPDEIRRAFRVQALVNHPDRGGDRVEFELVVLAFETLQHIDVASPLSPREPGSCCRPGPRSPAPARASTCTTRPAAARRSAASTTCCAPRWARPRSERGAVAFPAVDAWELVGTRGDPRDRRVVRALRRLRPLRRVRRPVRARRRARGARRSARSTDATRSVAYLDGVGRRSRGRVGEHADDPPPRVEPDDHRASPRPRRRARATSSRSTEHGVDHWGRYRDQLRSRRRPLAVRAPLRAHRRPHARRLGRDRTAAARLSSAPRRPRSAGRSRTRCGRRRRCRCGRPAASTCVAAARAPGTRRARAGRRASSRRSSRRSRCAARARAGCRRRATRPRRPRSISLADRDHRVDEAVDLAAVLRLRRLDHQRARDRERHRRRVEAVVDEPLGDVVDGHARLRGDRADVDDALVRDETVRARVEHRVVRREAVRDVVRVEDRDLRRLEQPFARPSS